MTPEDKELVREIVLNRGVINSVVDGKIFVICGITNIETRMALEAYRTFIQDNDNPDTPETNEDTSINLVPSIDIVELHELTTYVQGGINRGNVNSEFGFAKFRLIKPKDYEVPKEYIVPHLRDYPKALENGKNLGNVLIS